MLRPYVHAADLSQRRDQPRVIRRPDEIRGPRQPIGGDIAEAIDAAFDFAVIAREAARPDVIDALIEIGGVVRQIGVEEDLGQLPPVKIGDGFAGHVAAEQQPVFLRDAATDPRVTSEVIQNKGVRA